MHHPREVRQLSGDPAHPLEVLNAAGDEAGPLAGKRDLFTPLAGPVEVIGGDLQLERVEDAVVQAVVVPDQVGLVLVDQLDVLRDPLGHELRQPLVAVVDPIEILVPRRVQVGLHVGRDIVGSR